MCFLWNAKFVLILQVVLLLLLPHYGECGTKLKYHTYRRQGSFFDFMYTKSGLRQRGSSGFNTDRLLAILGGTTSTPRRLRSTFKHVSLDEHCDYLAQDCLRGFQTGKVCGRTIYYRQYTFKNYCMLDYVNCVDRYDAFSLIHMGDCLTVWPNREVQNEPHHDSRIMNGYYMFDRELK